MSSISTTASATATDTAATSVVEFKLRVLFVGQSESFNVTTDTTVGEFRHKVHATNNTIPPNYLIFLVAREKLQSPASATATASATTDDETAVNYVRLDDDARTLGSYGILRDMSVDVLVREKVLTELGTYMPRTFSSPHFCPHGMCISPDGSLYVTSSGTKAVCVTRSSDGSLIRTISMDDNASGKLLGPSFICLSQNGNHLFVSDVNNHQIQVFQTADGEFVRSLGSLGSLGSRGITEGQFKHPTGLCLSLNGNYLFVVDSLNHRVQMIHVLDSTCEMIIGSQGNGAGQFNYPRCICLSADGELFVTDSCNHRIQVFNAVNGDFLRSFGSNGRKVGEFQYPSGICLSQDDQLLLVADTVNNRVQVMNASDGEHVKTISACPGPLGLNTLYCPDGICLSPNQDFFFVSEPGNNKVLMFKAFE